MTLRGKPGSHRLHFGDPLPGFGERPLAATTFCGELVDEVTYWATPALATPDFLPHIARCRRCERSQKRRSDNAWGNCKVCDAPWGCVHALGCPGKAQEGDPLVVKFPGGGRRFARFVRFTRGRALVQLEGSPHTRIYPLGWLHIVEVDGV